MILRGLIFVLRVVGFLLVLRLVLRALASLSGPREAPGPAPSRPRTAPPTDLVRDRVCNTFVPRDRALRATVGGRDEHFCSETCRDRALAEARAS